VKRPSCIETTALGAAYLAGLAVGFWKNKEELLSIKILEKEFFPTMTKEKREKSQATWQKAVATTFGWSK